MMGFLLRQILSDPSWPQTLNPSQLFTPWDSAEERITPPVSVVLLMGVVVSLRSSVQPQIRRCPCHGSLAGQRPERQRLQPVGRGRGDERGGQRHLPGAQIVSLTAARAWITNSLCDTHAPWHTAFCVTHKMLSHPVHFQNFAPPLSLQWKDPKWHRRDEINGTRWHGR